MRKLALTFSVAGHMILHCTSGKRKLYQQLVYGSVVYVQHPYLLLHYITEA